jgi:serine/threonine protein kinase
MNADSGQDVAIFSEAISLPEEERDAYVARACAGDTDLRDRVAALLQAYKKVDDFMQEPAPGLPEVIGHAPAAGEKPGDLIGRYKLLQQIGEGGYGVVFMAEQQEPIHRRVALKIIKPGMDTKSVIARFEAERQALALMDHPSIAKVFDAGATKSGRPYFVMELIRGVKITEYCDQQFLTTEERLKLFFQVCQAVQHAHQKGIIHRDIKPSNILVTTSVEGTALPVVIDFGIAKATTNQRLTDKTLFTAFEMLVGTPAYMSPEQAALTSVDVDTRTDIYSLGVLLYELLTGSTPFNTLELLKIGLDEIRRVIREQEPDRPSTRLSKMTKEAITTIAQSRQSEPPKLIRSVHGDLDWIVMKALEKDRRRRYETANGLALDVQRFLDRETISARPPSKLYKFQKTVQRNGILFTGIAVITILLIVSLILVSASLAKERQSRLEAKQVKQFLEEMLKGVEPEVALGRDTTILREILDKAAARIDQETNQPAVAAELRSVIGAVYERTDQYRQAEEMQRTVLAFCREHYGPKSPETAAALNELGITLIASGKKVEAEEVNREALEIRRRCFGDGSAEVATSEDNLAHACNDNGQYIEAETLIREALATRRKLFGEESPEVADSLRNQVIILGGIGKWPEAEATAREVLALRYKLLGPQDPSIAAALADLAWTAGGNGNQNEAEVFDREALELRQKVLSDNYSDVASSLYHLGDRMRQRGNFTDAYSVLSTAFSLFRKSLGNNHPYTLYTLSDLGMVCEAENNWSEAETLFRQELDSWRKQAGDNQPETLYAMRSLEGALEGQGKWAEAETLHREALASWRKRAGNEDPGSLWEVWQLARNLEMQKKFSEAKQVLDETLIPAFAQKPASGDLQFSRIYLMGRQGRWAEAEADLNFYIATMPVNHYAYHLQAGILAITQNRTAYHQLCQKILRLFADTTNPYIAERVADDCLVLPNSGADLQTVDKLADIAVASTNDASTISFNRACKALSEYRQGKLTEAAAWAAKSLNTPQTLAGAKGCAVLAMADWRLGEKNEARTILALGNALAPRLSPTNNAVDLGDTWMDWNFARVALDEAGALIEPATTSPTRPKQNDQTQLDAGKSQ